MHIEVKVLDTGMRLVRLTYKGKTYSTGCFFQEEFAEKVQLLIYAALKPKEDDTIR